MLHIIKNYRTLFLGLMESSLNEAGKLTSQDVKDAAGEGGLLNVDEAKTIWNKGVNQAHAELNALPDFRGKGVEVEKVINILKQKNVIIEGTREQVKIITGNNKEKIKALVEKAKGLKNGSEEKRAVNNQINTLLGKNNNGKKSTETAIKWNNAQSNVTEAPVGSVIEFPNPKRVTFADMQNFIKQNTESSADKDDHGVPRAYLEENGLTKGRAISASNFADRKTVALFKKWIEEELHNRQGNTGPINIPVVGQTLDEVAQAAKLSPNEAAQGSRRDQATKSEAANAPAAIDQERYDKMYKEYREHKTHDEATVLAQKDAMRWLGYKNGGDAPRVQAPRVQAPRVQAPRVQAPRVQAPRVQAPRVQAQQVNNSAVANDALNNLKATNSAFGEMWTTTGDLSQALSDYCYNNSRGGLQQILQGGQGLSSALKTLNGLGVNGDHRKLNLLANELATITNLSGVEKSRFEGVKETIVMAAIGAIMSGGTSIALFLGNARFGGKAKMVKGLDAGRLNDIKTWLQSGATTPRPVYRDYGNGLQTQRINSMQKNVVDIARHGNAEQKEIAKWNVNNTAENYLQQKGIPDIKSLRGVFSWIHKVRSGPAPKRLDTLITALEKGNYSDGNVGSEMETAKEAYSIIYKEAFRETVNSLTLDGTNKRGPSLGTKFGTLKMNPYFEKSVGEIRAYYTAADLKRIDATMQSRGVIACLGTNIHGMDKYVTQSIQILSHPQNVIQIRRKISDTEIAINKRIEKTGETWQQAAEHCVVGYKAEKKRVNAMPKQEKQKLLRHIEAINLCEGVSMTCPQMLAIVVPVSVGGGSGGGLDRGSSTPGTDGGPITPTTPNPSIAPPVAPSVVPGPATPSITPPGFNPLG